MSASIKYKDIPSRVPTLAELINVLYSRDTDDINFISDFQSLLDQYSAGQVVENTLFATSMQDLIDEFGVDLEIPAGVSHTVYYDESFTQTKGFKLNTGSSLFLRSRTETVNTTYTPDTTGEPLIAGITPTTIVGVAVIQYNARIECTDNTAPVFNVTGNNTTRCGVENNVLLTDFESLGRIKNFVVANLDTINMLDFLNGAIIDDCTTVNISTVGDNNGALTARLGRVSFAIRAPVGRITTVNLSQILSFSKTDESALLLVGDITLNGATRFTVEKYNKIGAGDFYKTGQTNTPITAAADGGNDTTIFSATTTPAIGAIVNLNGFVTETSYNALGRVLAITAGVSFTVDIPFVVTDSGSWMDVSFDQTNVQVTSLDNPNQPDSMTIAENRQGATDPLVIDNSGGGDVAVVDTTPAAGDFIQDAATERFTINTTTGLITYDGLEEVDALIIYQLSVTKSSPSQISIFSLHDSGGQIAKTAQSLDVDTSLKQLSYHGIFKLSPGETIQMFQDPDGTSNVDVSDFKIIIIRQ